MTVEHGSFKPSYVCLMHFEWGGNSETRLFKRWKIKILKTETSMKTKIRGLWTTNCSLFFIKVPWCYATCPKKKTYTAPFNTVLRDKTEVFFLTIFKKWRWKVITLKNCRNKLHIENEFVNTSNAKKTFSAYIARWKRMQLTPIEGGKSCFMSIDHE